MLYLPRRIRSAIVWLFMMPAALWAGLQAPECECATGEHRYFCPRMFGATTPVASSALPKPPKNCCSKSAEKQARVVSYCAASKATPRGSSGMRADLSEPCSQCKAVPSSPLVLSDSVKVPTAEHTAWLPLSSTNEQVSHTRNLANALRSLASDQLPTIDRVVVQCRLLI